MLDIQRKVCYNTHMETEKIIKVLEEAAKALDGALDNDIYNWTEVRNAFDNCDEMIIKLKENNR